MAETFDSSDVLELKEADYSTDIDAVLLNALDKRACKIKLVPWVAQAPTYEIFLERKEKAIKRSGVCKRTFEYWLEAYRSPDGIDALTRLSEQIRASTESILISLTGNNSLKMSGPPGQRLVRLCLQRTFMAW